MDLGETKIPFHVITDNLDKVWPILAIAVGVLFFVALFKLVGGDRTSFTRRPSIFTPRESKFFHLLREATGDRYLIFPQIPLRLILEISCNDRKGYNDIAHKTPDFILADPKTLETVLVIELDDRSHDRADRQLRDQAVERGLSKAKVSLLRLAKIPSTAAELRTEIANALQNVRAK